MVAVVFHVLCHLREYVGEERKHEKFDIPKCMSAVLFPGQQFCSDTDSVICLISGTHQVEDIKPYRTIQFRVAFKAYIRLFPHVVVHFAVFFQLRFKSVFTETVHFFFDGRMERIGRALSFCIHGNIFHKTDCLTFCCCKISKFHSLLTERIEHPVSHNLLFSAVRFQHASASHMEMTVSRCGFHVNTVLAQLFICCQIHVFYFETRRIIEVDDRSVYDIFHFDDSFIVHRCHKKLDCHSVYIVPAHKSASFDLCEASFSVFEHILLGKNGMLHVQYSGEFHDLAVFDADQLFFHIKADSKPVRQCCQLSHECF